MCTVSMAMVVGVMIGGLSVLMTPRAIAGDLSLASAPRAASVDLTPPLYEPRLHPSPKARIEGVARALDNNGPIVLPLVPDHVGLTMVRQPVLYWYLSKPISSPVMFVLVDTRSIQVIRDAILSPHPESGIQTISLKDLGVSLEPNVLYRWYLTVVLDIDSPSRDIVSGGMIERTAEVLNISDFPTFRGDTVRFYAEQGLWYDAFASISDLIVAAPDNQILRNQRASLLQQIGLQEVATWDLQQVSPN